MHTRIHVLVELTSLESTICKCMIYAFPRKITRVACCVSPIFATVCVNVYVYEYWYRFLQVYVYVYAYVCMRTCMRMCMYLCTCLCMCMCMCMRVCVWAYVRVWVVYVRGCVVCLCVCVCVYMCMFVGMCTLYMSVICVRALRMCMGTGMGLYIVCVSVSTRWYPCVVYVCVCEHVHIVYMKGSRTSVAQTLV